MLFSFSLLQSFLKKKLPKPKDLANALNFFAFEVEDVKKDGKDWVFDVDILPNRPDCLSHFGLAREISAIFKIPVSFPKFRLIEEEKKADEFLKVKVESAKDCPRYLARVILGVKVKESPDFLKKILKRIGQAPINNVVDITNYLMFLTGQPLHAFDLDKIDGREIFVRRAKNKEKIITLENREYNLDEEILVIADRKEPLAIAGIKGGKKAEITKDTKNIVLESADFDPILIRKASQKLFLFTEASKRFSLFGEKTFQKYSVDFAAFLIRKIAGGKVAKGVIEVGKQKSEKNKILLSHQYLESLLGTKIPEKEVFQILKRLGFEIKKEKPKFFLVSAPSFRKDINLPEDVIEEIGRLFGYQKIEPKFPASFLPPKPNPEIIWENKISDILKSLGFCEVLNYIFLSKEDLQKIQFPQSEVLEIANPVSLNFQFLRPTLLVSLLKNLSKNQNYFSEIKIFEIGKVFFKKDKKIFEKKMLAGLISGQNFLEAKGVILALGEQLGIGNVWFTFYKQKEEKFKILKEERSCQIKLGEEKIGILGEAEKEILDFYQIKN
jgi:phenylalanyl-tRNA synthetase beta chain